MSKKRKNDEVDLENARKLASIVLQLQPLVTTCAQPQLSSTTLPPAQPLETPQTDVPQPTSLLFTTPSSSED